jgi:hypothetical protein
MTFLVRQNEFLVRQKDRAICFYIVFYQNQNQNFKFFNLNMAKIQGSGGLIRKRKIAILNIDSIVNNFFLNNFHEKIYFRVFDYVQNVIYKQYENKWW